MASNQRTMAFLAGGLGAVLAARAWKAARAIDFAGKSAVVVGGSRGLGLVIARELAAEGARLTLVARDEGELQRAQADLEGDGATVATIACDIRDREQVERTIARVAADRGGIDVLINDAGIIQVGPLDHMEVEDF